MLDWFRQICFRLFRRWLRRWGQNGIRKLETDTNWDMVKDLVALVYEATDALARQFPERKFTPDGHLVGSLGEVIAAYMFGLTLHEPLMRGHDAVATDGRRVEIKLTQGDSVAFREKPDHAIVLQRKRGEPVVVAFNGPGCAFWDEIGPLQRRNGQQSISIKKLSRANDRVTDGRRLRQCRPAPF